MSELRILITNNTLKNRAGTELYVRDVALGLLKRGHTPIAYSPTLGEVAKDIRAATIPVIDNLDALAEPPDVIHGHHHLETMTALLRFPGVPAVSFCHGWLPWEENPPRFPRILRYVAVDHACRDRLLFEHGVPEGRVRVLLNFVDLERFKPRGPLPARPQRALIFSNNANEHTQAAAVREACVRVGLTIDSIGLNAGNVCERPEEILGAYDIVFARGRSALEALAVGAAAILCDKEGVGPMVTTSDFERLRPLNFGLRALTEPITVENIERQIARYNAADATKVSQLVRATAGQDAIVDQIVSLYREVIAENKTIAIKANNEARAAAEYLRFLAPTLKAANASEHRAHLAESERAQLLAECDRMRALLLERDQALQTLPTQFTDGQEQLRQQLDVKQGAIDELSMHAAAGARYVEEINARLAEKENQLKRINNSLGWRLLSRYGRVKYGVLLPAYKSIGRVLKPKPHAGSNNGEAFPALSHGEASPVISDGENSTRSELVPIQELNPPAMKEIFSDIYCRRAWGEDCESVSGPGSGVLETSPFRNEIPALLKEINAETVLDAGCGDFNWMKLVELDLQRYIGVDVVPELVSEHQRQYGNSARVFLNLDISRDKLPKVDLIISRDCLVHFSFKHISAAIKNFKQSGTTYLLTTTFTSIDSNTDVETGGWRPLNLQLPPFNFPEPLKFIDEKRPGSRGIFADKHLALWALKDIPL